MTTGPPDAPRRAAVMLRRQSDARVIDYVGVQPHLSKYQMEDAKECFLFHSVPSMPRPGSMNLSDMKRSSSRGLLSSLDSGIVPTPVDIHANRTISLSEVRQAVMDLGYFPTAEEVVEMHAMLSEENSDTADLDEFLEMVKTLALAKLTDDHIEELAVVYKSYCDDKGQLWRRDLSKLLENMGHPEDEVEIEYMMHEWDVDNSGHLDFDAFVSMIAVVLKKEELDEIVERDFLEIAEGHRDRLPLSPRSKLATTWPQDPEITAESLIRRFAQLGHPVGRDIAREMIFDATGVAQGRVSLDDLINSIEIIGRDEVIADEVCDLSDAQSARVAVLKARACRAI